MTQEAEVLGRRDNDCCPYHEENSKIIGKHGYVIGRHSGQWTLLLWILGIGIGLMTTIAGTAYYTQVKAIDVISHSVYSIDKVMTNYVSVNTEKSKESVRRIAVLEYKMNGLGDRVTDLEHK